MSETNEIDAGLPCYHCGLPIPTGVGYSVDILAQPRALCCAGCQAVAQTIVAHGLETYYQSRDALPESPREALPPDLLELGLFDLPEVQKNFARNVSEHEREAALMIEGITCAACVWLNETHMAKLPGVTAVMINYVTRRARVRWDERQIKLSKILEAVANIGYRAHPFDAAKSEQLAGQERRRALWRLFVAGFGMMQVMMYAVPAYLAGDGEMSAQVSQLLRWASLLLTLPVMLYSALPFFVSAWRDISRGQLGMDVPVALGIGSAFIASCWATFTGVGEVYFDSVAMFVFFLLGGRYLELMARQKSVRGVETVSHALPAFTERFLAWPAEESERIAVAHLAVGDIVRIKPGETVPADGETLSGMSAVDESLLTGESRHIEKVPGSLLIGGSINCMSVLVMRVLYTGEATRLAAIARLMERSAAEKPSLVKLADRVASGFVLALVTLATFAGLYWWQVQPQNALWIFVAVLVVSCPCALSLATPAALTVATGALARFGVLVTRGHAIETLARATHFVFDKTGTLTIGQPVLTAYGALCAGEDKDEMLALAVALERASEHPLARAICQAGAALPRLAVENIRVHTGQGITGDYNGQHLRLGKPEFALANGAAPLYVALRDNDTLVVLAIDEVARAYFCLSDAPRAGAVAAIAELAALNVHIQVMSGDRPTTVSLLAQELHIQDAEGNLSPEGKHARIHSLQAQGAVVAMVGDGVNDAPVLAQAQVSIAMAEGADLAKSQADIVFLNGDLRNFAAAVVLARRTLRIIRQNLYWAAAYNFSAIPLAMCGYITPWMAGIGMSASSLLVVLNALRLQAKVRQFAKGVES